MVKSFHTVWLYEVRGEIGGFRLEGLGRVQYRGDVGAKQAMMHSFIHSSIPSISVELHPMLSTVLEFWELISEEKEGTCI